MNVYTLIPGTTPVLVSLPHAGSFIPEDLRPRFVERALASVDTDWHLERLYHFVLARGAGLIQAHHSRYVIDLNRPPDDAPLYSTNTTGLCPTRFFTGEPLYREDQEPTKDEIISRRERYWQPYHAALSAELARLKTQHGHAILFDAHSIRSRLPWLFEGKLPDFNLGTADGTSCTPRLQIAIEECFRKQSEHTFVSNGRFKGGYITRHYGKPANGIETVQMEMCQCTYMNEETLADEHRTPRLLEEILNALLSIL